LLPFKKSTHHRAQSAHLGLDDRLDLEPARVRLGPDEPRVNELDALWWGLLGFF
jgi:hypothetical protein